MFNIGDYVLSNYMLSHGDASKTYPIYCIGKLSKYNRSEEYDFAIRNVTAIDKETAKFTLVNLQYYNEREQYGCWKGNLRSLELTDPHFINAIVNQVFIEKEEEGKFKEYIRIKIQTDFKIPTLDSGYGLSDIISVNKGILTEGEIYTTKPNVVWI